MAKVTDKEVASKKAAIKKLRERIAKERDSVRVKSEERTNEVVVAQLDAEQERLEAELARLQRAKSADIPSPPEETTTPAGEQTGGKK